MNKPYRLIKKRLALILVLLFSIESFAAVVGDNDGAAFITKAEFDSMKNNFQSQLDRYNSSIDNKIDGAIASYLDGISISKESILDNLIANASANNRSNVGFVKWRDVVETMDKVDLEAAFFCGLSVGVLSVGEAADNDTSLKGWGAMTNNTVNAGEAKWTNYATVAGYPTGGTSAMWWARFPFAENVGEQREHQGNTSDWLLADHMRHRCHFRFKAEKNSFRSWAATIDPNNINWVAYNKDVSVSAIGTNAESQPGSWSGSTYTLGISGLTQTPECNLVHNWSYVNTADNNAYKYLDYQIAGNIIGSAFACDYDYRDSYHPAGRVTVPCQNASNCGVDLRWRTNKEYKYNPSHSGGGTSDTSGWTFKWTLNRQKPYILNWANLMTDYFATYFSGAHYKYNGIPICKTSQHPGTLKFKLRFINKVLSSNADLSPSTAPYTYVIMDKVFKNGNLPSTTETELYYKDSDGYNHVFKKDTVNSGTAQYTSDWIVIDKSKVFDRNGGDYIFIKVEPSEDDQVVFVEVVDQITYTET